MDDDPPSSSSWFPNDTALAIEQYLQAASCALCQKSLSSTRRVNNEFEQSHVCGDCKFLLHEDFNTPATAYPRRHGGRVGFSSSESVESILCQQYAHMMNTLRENQLNASQQEFQSGNGNAADCLQQSASSRTTPSESRRWRWALSDTESECLENFASHFGDSESNASLGRYRLSHNESDSFSFSAYGGDSDASVDTHSITDSRMFAFPGEDTEIDSDSDTDIDPMRAGLSIWDLDDEEIEEEEQQQEDMDNQRGSELTEAEGEDAGNQFLNFWSSNLNETVPRINRRQLQSPDSLNLIRPRIRDSWETLSSNIFTNLEELDLHLSGGNSRDRLNSRGFEILLENFVENGISRRGAPPTSVSFVDSLPCIAITEEQEKAEKLACAICKDVLAAGTEVNQLPCFHLYHRSCIMPWLCSRNSCPLCRYELPTDDKDYEEGKNLDSRLVVHEIVQNVIDDSLSDVSDGVGESEGHEFDARRDHQGRTLTVGPDINSPNLSSRGRWFFLAAAPVVSLVGIAFVLWFGKPLIERRMPTAGRTFSEQNRPQVLSSVSSNARENRSKRWWSNF